MADTEQPRRNRKGPRKSRFTDANPDQEEEERSDADRGPNVSSTESEDSDVEAVRKVQDIGEVENLQIQNWRICSSRQLFKNNSFKNNNNLW